MYGLLKVFGSTPRSLREALPIKLIRNQKLSSDYFFLVSPCPFLGTCSTVWFPGRCLAVLTFVKRPLPALRPKEKVFALPIGLLLHWFVTQALAVIQ